MTADKEYMKSKNNAEILKELQSIRRDIAELKGSLAYVGFLACAPMMHLSDEVQAGLIEQGADAIGFCIEDGDDEKE